MSSSPALTGGNDAYITGWPFAGTTAPPNGHGIVVPLFTTFAGQIAVMIENGSAAARIREASSAANQDFVTVSEVDNSPSATLHFVATYMTD